MRPHAARSSPAARLAILLGLLAAAASCAETRDSRALSEGPLVYRVPVTGVVELGLAPFIERSIREAEAAGASALVLDMETPGGRVDAAQRIANALSDAPLPVYAFVNRRAYSAGALIAIATDRVFMREGSVLGAATPVTGEGDKAPEKIVSAMRSEMRALAQEHGLDPRVAEAMVDEDIEIEGVVERGKLLTLTADEAARLGYAAVVDDWEDLLAAIDHENAQVLVADENWAELVVRFLSHPVVAPFLLSIGFLGLIVEIKTAGFGAAGLLGLVSITLFFGAHMIVGLAGWEEVILLGIGLVLLGIEMFVVPGFGIFGIGGTLAVLASIYLSLVGHLSTGIDYSQAAMVLSVTALIILVGAWALIRTLPRNRRLARSGVFLADELDRETGYLSAAVRDELIDAHGVAATDLRPAGAGVFGEERLDVVAEAGWIEAGTPIRIVRSEGYRLVVRPEKPVG